MIRILVAGEGANEIGRFAAGGRSASEAEQTSGPGVIEALLFKVRPGGWQIRRGVLWRDIRKYRPGAPGKGDVLAVNGLVLMARELGCNALVFLRDRDGSRSRERAIAKAVKRARKLVARPPVIAAGVPIEMLEAWLLALRGEPSTELCPDPVSALHERYGIPPKSTTAMVRHVQHSGPLKIAADARSLRRWLRLAAKALHTRVPKRWPLQTK